MGNLLGVQARFIYLAISHPSKNYGHQVEAGTGSVAEQKGLRVCTLRGHFYECAIVQDPGSPGQAAQAPMP